MDEQLIRKEIISFTRTKIMRHGTCRINMDSIARDMHISKRTLYALFNDKNSLLSSCVDDMKQEYIKKVEDYLASSTASPSHNLRWLMREYLRSLYLVDYSFLLDLKEKSEFNRYHNEYQDFWVKVIIQAFRKLCTNTLTHLELTIKNLLEIANRLRLEGIMFEEQEKFFEVMVRGISV